MHLVDKRRKAYGNDNDNVNANFFEHELLGLAGARIFSLQK